MSKGNYPVGYKKPPKHTQFKKGQSGNPKGRSKRSDDKHLLETLDDVLKQLIPVKQGASTKMMQRIELVIHTLFGQSSKGNVAASKLLLQYAEKAAPIEQLMRPPVMIIRPPDGPRPPMPPVYGEESD